MAFRAFIAFCLTGATLCFAFAAPKAAELSQQDRSDRQTRAFDAFTSGAVRGAVR